MRTLYIDHSIVTCERSWENVRRAVKSGKVRLALSLWNLVEIGWATDEGQRERRLAFLVDELRPLWVVERLDIQRQEVQRFLWEHKFHVQRGELIALAQSLSVVQAFFAGAKVQIGLTARQFIRETNFENLIASKCLSANALKCLQNVDRKSRKNKEREIFFAWVGALLPQHGPDGLALTLSERNELVAFCWEHKGLFFANCRCLAVEDALAIARTNDAGRKPTQSDGVDLQHTVVALACCDVFYSKDRYQAQCAATARDVLKSMSLGAVCQTPEALASVIATF